jgi:hypothetical protein
MIYSAGLAKWTDHQRGCIEMEAETKRLELEVYSQEAMEYHTDEESKEYWDTYKEMKVIKAKWDLEFHKLNMYHMIEVWVRENPDIIAQHSVKSTEVEDKSE